MTAWGSQSSPNTVALHHPRVKQVKGLATAQLPSLTIPIAADDHDHHDRRYNTKNYASLATNVTLRRYALGCGIAGLTLLFLFMLGSGVTFLWRYSRSATSLSSLLVDANGGFAPDEEFLTAADYAAAFPPGRPHGEACFTAADCLAGSICAFPALHNNSIRICCADAVQLGSSIVDQEDSLWLSVCTGAPLGAACANHDAICASQHCIGGICVAQTLPDHEPCTDDADCQSGACGFYQHDLRHNPVCCPGGVALTAQPATVPYEIRYCGNLPLGAICGDVDEICASQWCSHGVCRDPSTRRKPKTTTTTSSNTTTTTTYTTSAE